MLFCEIKESATQPMEPEVQNKGGGSRLMAVLAYLGILIIIPAIFAKDRPFVKFHLKQGLVLLITGFVVFFLYITVLEILPGSGFISIIIGFALFILSVIGVINAISGKEEKIPLIGDFGDKFNF